MGENGAGKSTLMKILTGIYARDTGEIKVRGKLVDFKNPKEAEHAGIASYPSGTKYIARFDGR